ncbi:aminomethyl transferase family protein [candidate division KSB1 bacterium]|nr:aminomethyl transferase family protein [candidate division KSB1 bacterium]
MPVPSPFHSRTSPLCKTHEWRNWSGYIAVSAYEPTHDREYFAIRNAAGLIDVSPLFKYEITGSDAARLVDRIITRNAIKCKIGQVMYTPWCDEEGKVIDDGTVSRLAENHFRITSADPSLRWFEDCGFGMDIQVNDVTEELAALALQGPNSREILKQIVKNVDLDGLKFFHLTQVNFDNFPVTISRTGYTGDLGYELWVSPKYAEEMWDILMDKGADYGIFPAGMVALDIVRIEAGLLLIEVDYISSMKALTEFRKSSPFELGLGWTVKLKKKDFIGKTPLVKESKQGSGWSFVGLEIHWEKLEQLYAEADLPPLVAGRASRDPLPVFKNGKQIGQMTSSTFSPLLKKYIAMGSIESKYAIPGSQVEMEITIEFHRKLTTATIVKTPFFDPPRKKA